MKKLLFLVNPVAGAGAGAALAGRIARAMRSRMPEGRYDIMFTTADATAQARDLAPRYETVVAAGGDGTISRIARGLAGLPAPVRLGVIPLGTGNDCARSLGLLPIRRRGGLAALIDLMQSGPVRPVDVLTFGPEHMFINYAGLGRDAAIAASFDRVRRRSPFSALCERGGSKFLYMLIGLACARHSCAPGIALSYQAPDGSTHALQFPHRLCQLVIGNIDSYGGGVRISSRTSMDDGLFEVAIIRGSARWVLLHLGRLTGRAYDSFGPADAVIQARQLGLQPAACSTAQVDGETVAIAPHACLDVRRAARIQMIAAPAPGR
jgi:diacylglycerol kinase (ATP)